MKFGKALLANPTHRDILPADAPPNRKTRQKLKVTLIFERKYQYCNSFVPFLKLAKSYESCGIKLWHFLNQPRATKVVE